MLADVAAHVRSMMAADAHFHADVPSWKLYITTHDAVHRAQEELRVVMMMAEGEAEGSEAQELAKLLQSIDGGEEDESFLKMTGSVPGGGGGESVDGGGGDIGNKVKKKAPGSSSSRFAGQSGGEVLLSMDEGAIVDDAQIEEGAKKMMMIQSEYFDADITDGRQSAV